MSLSRSLLVIGFIVVSFVVLLKVFWPLIVVLFIIYILSSIYQSIRLNKRRKQMQNEVNNYKKTYQNTNFTNQSNHKNQGDIIDAEFSVVDEEVLH